MTQYNKLVNYIDLSNIRYGKYNKATRIIYTNFKSVSLLYLILAEIKPGFILKLNHG